MESFARSTPRRFSLAVAAAIGSCVLFSAWVGFGFGGEAVTTWFDDVATAIAATAAATLCFRAGRRRDIRRPFWLWLGLSLSCWTAGEFIWGYYELVRGIDAPFPSLADFGYLTALPLVIVALGLYPTIAARQATGRLRPILDGLIIATSLLFVSWAFVLAPVVRHPGHHALEGFVALAYPVGDVAIASVAIIALHRGRSLTRSPLLFVAGAIVLNAFSDSAYAYLTQTGRYASGNMIDVGWFAAYALFALAAVVPPKPPTASTEGSISVGDLVAPYSVLGTAVCVAGLKMASHEFHDQTLQWLGLACVVLVVVRQLIALLDNVALSRGLEAKVAARTDELTEALAAANEVSRLKTAFLANMSHEIRTPMNGILGMLALLLDRALDPVERDYAETMASSAESLMAIINDILDFSKLEAGMVDPEHLPFPIRSAIESAVAGAAPRARQQGLELVSVIDPDVPDMVVGDRLRLRQVLANLLDNAVKFSTTGDVIVRVQCQAPGTLRFEVQDGGIGIEPAGRDRLFDSFTQADVSTTRRFGGTGLGLAICKQLVEVMQGEIGVESELGVGSTFWFALPFGVAPAEPDSPSRDEPFRNARVLLVSAHAAMRESVGAQLRHETIRVVEASDPACAVELLRRAAAEGQPFAAMIIDDRVDACTQVDLARQAAAEPARGATRIVALALPEQVRTDTPEIDAWVTKPIRHSALLDRLASTLEKNSASSGPADLPTADPASHADLHPGRGTILVAEDNKINAKVAVAILDAMGYDADVAGDGVEAIEAMQRRSYDAVLMDVQMPRLNGYDATKEIRRSGDHTPIIAMTASAMDLDRVECLAAGMDAFLSKPIDREALAEVLDAWVGARQLHPTHS